MDQSEYSYLQCPAEAIAIQHEQLYTVQYELKFANLDFKSVSEKQKKTSNIERYSEEMFNMINLRCSTLNNQRRRSKRKAYNYLMVGLKLTLSRFCIDVFKFDQYKSLTINYIMVNSRSKIVLRLQLHLGWRANSNMHTLNKQMQEFLEAGFLYTFGRDYQFRPVIYLEAYRVDQKKYPKDFMIQVLSFFLGFVKKHMMMPGKVENWICIIDTKDIGVFGLPSGLGDIIKTMALNFVGCLHRMYVLNPSTGVDLSWKAGAAFMDDESKSKNVFLTKKTLEKLKEAIPQDQLEKKYLGTAENLTQFWPPRIAKK